MKDDRIHDVSALDTAQRLDFQVAGAVEQVDAELAHHQSAAAGAGGAIAKRWRGGPAGTYFRHESRCQHRIHIHLHFLLFNVCIMYV